jgi:uncharacterized protein
MSTQEENTLTPDEIDFVIYHDPCCDGFGSALCSYLYFKPWEGKNIHGKTVEYYPTKNHNKFPDVTGRNVAIFDFSYNRDATLEMMSKANKLLIIDHHKSAESELVDIPNDNKIFDMKHSGAHLAWKFFFPEEEVPLLIKYIEDNDIWLKQMPNTREVTSFIFTLPFEFEEYEKLLDEEYIKNTVIPTGIGMLKQSENLIVGALNYKQIKFVQIGNNYYMVVHSNSTVLKSDIGNRLLDKYPMCDFSSVYSTCGGTTSISLRSDNKKADVSVIAQKFGGGGHRNASGMAIHNTIEFPGKLIDNNISYGMLSSVYSESFISEDGVVFPVLSLNSSYNEEHFGKYLLQTKYIDSNGKNVQVGEALQKLCDNNSVYRLSCIWANYGNRGSEVRITCLDLDMFNILNNIFAKYKSKILSESNFIDHIIKSKLSTINTVMDVSKIKSTECSINIIPETKTLTFLINTFEDS